jgi:hypothetical protein
LPCRAHRAVADAKGVTPVEQNAAGLDVALTADELAVLDPLARSPVPATDSWGGELGSFSRDFALG